MRGKVYRKQSQQKITKKGSDKMPLFENLGKKVSSLAQEAVDSSKKLAQVTAAKSKNVAETSRLKSAIADEKKAIRHSFTKLGKVYYENRNSADFSAMAELCGEIDARYIEIESLEERLNQQRGIVVCPECSIEIEGECRFCPNCGTRLPEVVKVSETVEDDLEDVVDIDVNDEDNEAEVTVTADETENKEQ